jgi:hypothetical protein
MKKIKTLSIILGLISLIFGLLKFVNPFKEWYSAQIQTSGLPLIAHHLGILFEILTGVALLLPFLTTMDKSSHRSILVLAHTSLIIILIVAAIVHLNPEVPAEVLPLKIKPPFIPLGIMLITIFNLRTILKTQKI